MSAAIAKALPTCIFRTQRQVGFALSRKLLRRFTSGLNLLLYFLRRVLFIAREDRTPICTTSTGFGPILKRKWHLPAVFLAGSHMKQVGRNNSVSVIIQKRNSSTMRP
jgi:hypothetical protein